MKTHSDQREQEGPADAAPVLFVTRDTVVHAFHGANAAVHNLLRLLRDEGFAVTVLVTGGESRSPRLWFRETSPLPDSVRLVVPGYWHFGKWWVRPFSARGWARLFLRAAARYPIAMQPMQKCLRALRMEAFDRAWDLTEPTARERSLVLAAVERVGPAAVVANYAFWGPLLKSLRDGRAGETPRTMILMHDLLAEHVRMFEDLGLPLDCNRITPETEAAWLSGADAVLAIQEDEAAAVRSRITAQVLLQPMRLECERASPATEPLRCLFVGSNSPPNVQGLQWMMQDVWPHVMRAEPHAVLAAAGSVCDRVVPAPGVRLLGHVPSLAAEHRRAAVCVVPLRVGSGLKIKLLDALRFGKATVSTSVGVQGVERWAAGAVAVADDAEQFAAEVVRLLRSPDVRREREAAAHAMMQRHFSAGSEAERALLKTLRGESA